MERRLLRNITSLAVGVGALWASLALLRLGTLHGETFDLAFYTRMAWGLARGDFWEPLLDAHVLGLHLSPVLVPLGWLGAWFGTAATLLVAQALVTSLAAVPIAAFAARRFGPAGAYLGAFAWLAYPNLGHVATFEAHPGSFAILPLALLVDSVDRGSRRGLLWSTLGVLACREDLALLTAMAALVAAWTRPGLRRPALLCGLGSVVYLLVFALVLHPRFAPAAGSLEAHFGRWGQSPGAVLVAWLTQPLEVLAHLSLPRRLTYLPIVLGPLALLPLVRPRWLLVASPVLAINLLSDFPSTTQLDSHYLTPALPALVVGALDGASVLSARRVRVAGPALVVALVLGHLAAGGTPLAADFDRSAFVPDERTAVGYRALSFIPEGASVQAPDELLPHLAERQRLHRGERDHGDAWAIVDVSHRGRFRGEGTLLRTAEEPIVRAWLAREDAALRFAEEPYFVFERGRDPREGLGAGAIVGVASPSAGVALTGCLALLGAERLPDRRVALDLVARGPCAHDLALAIGPEHRPRRVELLFAGRLSPVHLRRGDRLRSVHVAPPGPVRVGVVRSSGARPAHEDPTSVFVLPALRQSSR